MPERNFHLCIDPAMGMAGDMFCAALIHLGASEDAVIRAMLRAAAVLGGTPEPRIETVPVCQSGVRGLRLRIDLPVPAGGLAEDEAREGLEDALKAEAVGKPYADFARRALGILLAAERAAHTGSALSGEFRVRPIGVAHTPYRGNAPNQPPRSASGNFEIEIAAEYAAGLAGLDSFSHIYVLSYLHASPGWSLTVTPPWQRGRAKRVGLFASRSPNRPNPIGVSVTELRELRGNRLRTGPLDLFDGTPVLDVKPYIRSLEPGEFGNDGWLAGTDHLRLHREGRPHRHREEKAVLHEAADILVDLVGAARALESLRVEPEGAVYLSPISVGGGSIEGSHGRLEVPAPAALRILRQYRLVHVSGPSECELLTPTGAALLAALVSRSRPRELGPPGNRLGSGHGFGTRRLEPPNLLRLHRFAGE